MNQQYIPKNQREAMEECEKQQAQLVWFQSVGELQQQLMPVLHSHGFTRG